MRNGLLFFLSAMLSSVLCMPAGRATTATSVSLPAGTRWFVTAPHPDRFAHEVSTFLNAAASYASSLEPGRVNLQAMSTVGLSLLDADKLGTEGVDTTHPWMLFERGGAQYLALTVKDRVQLAATLDAWGAGRMLAQREERRVDHPKDALLVTFSRAKGTRAAAGYLIAGDRAIVMVKPAERSAALVAAYDAVEGAVPIKASVDGTLLFWLGKETALRDGWVGVTARADGLDLQGEARKVDAGFVARDTSHADWVRAPTGSDRGTGEIPAWVRVLAGPKTGSQIVDGFIPLLVDSLQSGPAKPWVDELKALSGGAVELLATSVDVNAVETAQTGGIREDILRLVHPSMILPDRGEDRIASCLKTAEPALCQAIHADDQTLRSKCADPPLTVGRTANSLFLGWMGSLTRPAVPSPAGGSRLSCAQGTPIASARINLAVVAAGLDQVGFLGALTSQSLAGLLAIGSEYGPLMRASLPAVGLACLESTGRVTLQGHWRFARQ